MNSARLLVIDNYDSFTHNLVQMFLQFPLEIWVYRSDAISIKRIIEMDPDYMLVSPGPKDPSAAGISIEAIKYFTGRIPVLGVCLGMQCINEAYGGRTIRAPLPVHGKQSLVWHNGKGVFESIPSPFMAARYHSLAVVPCDDRLEISARTKDGVIMGIADPENRMFGVQFHPESFMTQYGKKIITNFLNKGRMGYLDDYNPACAKLFEFGDWNRKAESSAA